MKNQGIKSPINLRRSRRRPGNEEVMGHGQHMPRRAQSAQTTCREGLIPRTRLTLACQFAWAGCEAAGGASLAPAGRAFL